MRQLITKAIPLSIRNLLRPLYYALSRNKGYPIKGSIHGLTPIPSNQQQAFLSSAILGTLDFTVETDKLNVLLCAQPKSASLYMAKLLSNALDLVDHKIGFNNKSGYIYYPRAMAAKFAYGNTISHCHAEATPEVIQLIKNLKLRPVILTRNLLDSLVSRKNMLAKNKWAVNILSPLAIQKFLDGTGEYQLDVTINLFADGYINFFEGWNKYRGDSELRPVYITYQEMIDDESGLVSNVARGLGLEIAPEKVDQVSSNIKAQGGVNFSQGVPGKGKAAFNERQISELKRKALMLGCTNEEFLGFQL